jgi:hypothetical protein
MNREYRLASPSIFNLQIIRGRMVCSSTFFIFYLDKLIIRRQMISQLAYLVVPPRKHC